MMTLTKTILIVEDEANIRSFVRSYLEAEGFQVLEAENGKEGLEVLSKKSPDLIVTDIMMPEMDGIEFFKELRLSPLTRETPVIMLTVKDEFADIKFAYLMGVEEYVTKPFDPGVLVKHIQQILAKDATK